MSSDSDAQIGRNRAIAEHAHCADRIDTYEKAWGTPPHTLANNFGRQSGAGRSIDAGVGNFGLAEDAAVDADRGLEHFRRRLAAGARHAHTILADRDHIDAGEIEHDIGRKIGRRIVNLVEQLFDNCQPVDHAAGAGRLGDDDVTIGLDLRDRVSDSARPGTSL